MKALLNTWGRGFGRAFVASLIVFLPGILAATNFDGVVALGIAALAASVAAGFKVLVEYVPFVSFRSYIGQPFAAWLDAFVQGFLGAFLILSIGVLDTPNFAEWKSAVVGVIVGSLQAGVRAFEGAFTKGEEPAPGSGLPVGAPPA